MKIGIIGGGQLGQMLALAGIPLGFRFMFLDPNPKSPAFLVGESICADYTDEKALTKLADNCDVVTFEFENVDPKAIDFITDKVAVYPPVKALNIARDRLAEKNLFKELDIPTPEFVAINSQQDLEKAIVTIKLPAILKTRTLGYDGKGQLILKSSADINNAFAKLGEVPCILEQMIAFSHELSCIGVRNKQGQTAFYTITYNKHIEGILHYSEPALSERSNRQKIAEQHTKAVMESLDYVGILAFEFFAHVDNYDLLIANEIAPRVHNSGHWTIEGATSSQFDNHIRAITDLPLGSTKALQYCAMLNLVGNMPDKAIVSRYENVHFHDYHKSVKPGRKVGHITVCADNEYFLESQVDLFNTFNYTPIRSLEDYERQQALKKEYQYLKDKQSDSM